MSEAPSQFHYHILGVEQIALLQPLWKKLNAYEGALSAHFSGSFRARDFQQRKWEFVEKSKTSEVYIDLVTCDGSRDYIGYTIASLSPESHGEIDNIFVDEAYRGSGIGTVLMQRALAWMDARGATSKSVVVLFENDPAMRFYARFGFYPKTASLVQIV